MKSKPRAHGVVTALDWATQLESGHDSEISPIPNHSYAFNQRQFNL